MSAPVPVVAVRGSTGISMNFGPPGYDPVTAFTRDDNKTCKAMSFSPDGKYFAWTNGFVIRIVSTSTWKPQSEIQKPKVLCVEFSPKGTYLVTWEPYMVTEGSAQGGPNLNIWKTETGEIVKSFAHKSLTGWEPQWSVDERVFARLIGHEVHFYEDGNFEATRYRFNTGKVANFSLSPTFSPCYTLFFLPGNPGQPSFGRLFQYGKFENVSAIANKSFFQADRVDMYWNKKGTGVLLLNSTEYDRSGTSYYGKQTLHFISTKGETSMVVLGRDGPIYHAQWSPKSTEFCVVYGFMPAKATLFNFKCEPVFDFGTEPRNHILYNPFGNIVILGGFGNLPGTLEIWDVTHRKKITKVSVPCTTLISWSPDGEHFITATTAPKLRQENGFKIWHYSGALLYERPWNKQEELWEVGWQTFPPGTFKEPIISSKQVEGIQSSTPQASKQIYRPPSAVGKESGFKLHDDEPPSKSDTMSKNAIKSKKNREARKAKKESESSSGAARSQNHSTHPSVFTPSNGFGDIETGDPEKLKKMKKIRAKLTEISRLKEQKAAGKQLELNQVEKIKKEEKLMKELNELMLLSLNEPRV